MLNDIDLSRIDLNLLVLFEAVLAERHVGRAAARLHLTPSAVSHGLGRLRRLLNDPLFLRTPKGVVPTARAIELTLPIAEVLALTRKLIHSAEPFDPATSSRRFTIAAPDAVSAVLLPPLLAALRQQAPGIDLGVRQLLPTPGDPSERAWTRAFTELEARTLDIAIVPADVIPPRFEQRCIYEEDFVIAVRTKHPFARKPTLARYCEMQHLVVSESGDPYGFVDQYLTKQGWSRRIALTVPSFMFALGVVADSDFVCAMPRRLIATHAQRFGITGLDAPLPLPRSRLNAVASKAAMMDSGVAWLFGQLAAAGQSAPTRRQPSAARKRGA